MTEDAQKAAEKHTRPGGWAEEYSRQEVLDAFLAGAAWQRERMLALLRSDQVEKKGKVWALDFADWVEHETSESRKAPDKSE